MPDIALHLPIDGETAETLETERRLLGFESRAEYVRWLVENRGRIEPDADGDRRLEDRLVDLRTAASAHGDAIAEEPSARRASDRSDSGGSTARANADGSSPIAEDGGTESAATDALGENGDGIGSMHLAPERVERIRGDPVSDDADVLGSVQIERLDELSRRAVAKTRRRLNRDVETGLAYASSTGLEDDHVRPGEDVVELESLSVPGYDDERVERRRAVAGRAIAYLRDAGRARKRDFVDELYEEYPAGYDTADAWWECVKGALRQVEVIEGGEDSRVWEFDESGS